MKKLTDILYSFPFQLLILHLRSNLLLIFTWVLLALTVTGNFGGKFGLRYLFLAPEYMGRVGFWSFFYLGIGFGALVMSWNLTTYILSAFRFSFLASLGRPFTKFAMNNMVVPAGFTILFLYCQFIFGTAYELKSTAEVLWNSVGFLTGFACLVLLVSLYFNYTNKDIFTLMGRGKKKGGKDNIAPRKDDLPILENIRLNRNQWRVDTYLTETFRPRLVRSVAHYDPKLLLRVFRQNHLNALVVQLFTFIVLIMLGAFMDRPALRIPTGASIFLLASVMMAIAGAISYWFDRWRVTGILVMVFLINMLTRNDFFHHNNKAYGLDYGVKPAAYEPDSLRVFTSPQNVEKDKRATVSILENWKKKVSKNGQKPKMLLFCVSGGGLKSAAWSTLVLQTADSITGGQFMDHTALISGASGGMIGSTYFRELSLRKKLGEKVNLYDREHIHTISQDLLNPISFAIVTNDLFLPWATFEAGGHRYKKDRGYLFEKALNENTKGLLNKAVGDYAQPERDALVPMVFITPSIVNDGRRLVISAQPVAYMMVEPAGVEMPGSIQVDAVDFGQMFKAQGAENLRFTTALRMNATYPYVLPNVFLPSRPSIEVLDAGFRDNFGLKSATRFVTVFKDWIKENTGGLVFVIVRAFDRKHSVVTTKNQGVFETILNPLGIAFKVMDLQDYEHDNDLGFLYYMFGKENFDIVRFTYIPSQFMKDSPISFYLTERERNDILEGMGTEENRRNMEKLVEVLE
ncbi:MAG TPA: patatin-like phospholipase family protein [Bacteroidetes bacterium]|nr:patatin-like phospholipase family protein [Bacteroidota bacterium]